MSFTLQNTLPISSNAERHAAYVYMFDTFLSGLPQYTVTAHPDASAFKRSYQRASTNWLTGLSHTAYYWVTWVSDTSPTSGLTNYPDATYTTTPGDLGTSTNGGVSASSLNESAYSGFNMRFWYSDQSNASLITIGRHIYWYEPGYTHAAYYNDGEVWDGTASRRVTWYHPMMGDLASIGLPVTGAAGSSFSWGTSNYLIPSVASIFGPKLPEDQAILIEEMPLMIGSGGEAPNDTSTLCYSLVGNDSLFYTPSAADSNNRSYFQGDLTSNPLVLNNGRYYLLTSTSLTRQGLMIDFGPTEPSFA